MRKNFILNSWFIHLLIKRKNCLEKANSVRQLSLSKANYFENICSNSICNFEIRKQMFKEVSAKYNVYSFMIDFRKKFNAEYQLEDLLTFTKMQDMLELVIDNSNFIKESFRLNL